MGGLQKRMLQEDDRDELRKVVDRIRSWSSRPLRAAAVLQLASLDAEVRRCSVFS